MRRRPFFKLMALAIASIALLLLYSGLENIDVAHATTQKKGLITQGSLQAIAASGKLFGLCPLKHTAVKAEVSGFLSRVTVTQEFENSFEEKIEAVYTFPLPQAAAVDDMTMLVGNRTVKGKIMRREEAQAAYTEAKANGQVASLLDQERPNIFTQSVANILPGERITITISYVETLKYENGTYEFVFPMVVGPRYIPGGSDETPGTPTSADTDAPANADTPADTAPVPDASRITPTVMPEGMRAGHDISIEIALDTGVPIDALNSTTHEIEVERPDDHRALVRLKDQSTIPNKDFVFKYDVAGRRIEDALLTHRTRNDGFFTLILQPPDRVTVEDVTPKELVFVLDTSGSMQGFPLEKAKETVNLALDHLYPQDTFNLITFSGDTHVLFDQPVPATPENLQKAKKFLESRESDGGTEMMKAIRAALKPSDAQDHLRIACFMTDGEVGNDLEIIAEVQKHSNARVFAIGFGSAPNRFLLDKMAEYGRGEVAYVTQEDESRDAARLFFERVRDPLLTDISVEWSGLPVKDVYPKSIPDLFGAKPVILSGRYMTGGTGVIRLKGKMSGQDFAREIPVNLPESDSRHDVLATLWARRKIDDLMGQDMNGMQTGQTNNQLREAITTLGLQYRLMTQFTSFVAIEDRIVTDGSEPRRVEVPTETPASGSGSGGISENVTVMSTSSQMLVETTSSTITTVETRSISDLPLNDRRMLSLIYLASGVAPPANQSSNPTPAQIAVNGQRPGSNAFIVDGVSADTGVTSSQLSGTSNAGASPALTASGGTSGLTSVEATQEINLRTYNFQAEYGRVPGAQISIVTRSGTNEFHGSLFEYFGNDALDANDWFANSRGLQRSARRQNIFGGTLGGPIRKDKEFFFFSYEGSRQRLPQVGITDVPSIEARLAAPVEMRPFLNAFPLPTGNNRGNNLAEFASGYSVPARHDAGSIRVDANLNDRMRLYGRYNFASSEATERGGGLFSLNTLNRLGNRTQTLTAVATFINSPRVITDLRLNYSRATESNAFQLDSFGGAVVPSSAGQLSFLLPGGNSSSIFELQGRNAALKSADAIAGTQRQLNAVGSVSAALSTHTFKVGGDWRRLSPIFGAYQQEQNVFFNGLEQAQTSTASRLNLYSRTGTQRPVFNNLSIYGQDEWKVTPRLTLSYGLRWELAPAPSEQNEQDALAITSAGDPSRLSLASRGAPLWETTYGNFAPRAGLAYELSRASGGEMVLRGGVGLLYDLRNEAAGSAFTDSFPFLTGQSFFNVPFPVAANQATANPALPLSVPFVAFDPQLKLPYTLQWFASIERALGSDQKISLAFVGAAGRRLLLTQTLLEPHTDFSFVRLVNNDARSDYRSLQLQFERRLASGLQAFVSYTWAKSLDNVSQDSINRAMLLSSDRRLDRAPSDFDIRHQLAGNLTYKLPALFDSGLGNTLSRNWTINSLFYARSARPLNVVYAIPTSVGLAFLRPDLVAGQPLYLDERAAAGGRRLNADAFSIPALQRQGTLSRNALRGFPFHQIDMSLSRKFNLTDEVELQFSAEAFNLLNHPNMEDPLGNDLSLGNRLFNTGVFLPNTTFGQSTSLAGRSLWTGSGRGFNSAYGTGGPRSIQFSFRFRF
jgi:Ca-activated chloride channel family protein